VDVALRETVDADHHTDTARRRPVLDTARTQVDVVTVPPGGQLGTEVHAAVDETLIVVSGAGVAELEGQPSALRPGSVVHVSHGTAHNVHNPGTVPLRLYAVHAAPN